jgi:hypothetical protein
MRRVLKLLSPIVNVGRITLSVRGIGHGDNARISLCRSGTIERIRDMSRRSNTYTGYSIACAIVWGVILAGVSAAADSATRHKFMMVFGGWWIGWLSATIARAVYPPPKQRVGP